MTLFRRIPSIEHVVRRPALEHASEQYGRESVTQAARDAAVELRTELAAGQTREWTEAEAASWIEARALALVQSSSAASLRRVINATGVVIHTNLGRAPLAPSALSHAATIATGYSNLEYDLDTGSRGHRHVHAERLLKSLTGAESAVVVNNAAAAALLTLTALASGREVIVSRGELVEIGGGFRVPEILAQSGALLREVGTTNRTRASDYAAAISDRTSAILRVHPSNFQIQGFAERPSLADLVSLARRFSIPVIEDLGSGWLGLTDPPESLAGEPSVRASVRAGVDAVIFSGDKLLGGPQAGIIVGRGELLARLRAHPLMRALRADKLTYGVLETTLGLWAHEPTRQEIPVVRMLSAPASEIAARARRLMDRLPTRVGARIIDGFSTSGGGTAPDSKLPTALLTLDVNGMTADEVSARLRRNDPPIVGRIQDERFVLDLRTVAADDDPIVAEALTSLDRD